MDPDGTCTSASGGAPLRASAANAAFAARLSAAAEQCAVQWTEGMDQPDLSLIFGQ